MNAVAHQHVIRRHRHLEAGSAHLPGRVAQTVAGPGGAARVDVVGIGVRHGIVHVLRHGVEDGFGKREFIDVEIRFRLLNEGVGIGNFRIVQLCFRKAPAVNAKVFDAAGKVAVAPAGYADVVVLVGRKRVEQRFNVGSLSVEITVVIDGVVIRAVDVELDAVFLGDGHHHGIGVAHRKRGTAVGRSGVDALRRAVFEADEGDLPAHPRFCGGDIEMIVRIAAGAGILVQAQRQNVAVIVADLRRVGVAEGDARIRADACEQIVGVDAQIQVVQIGHPCVRLVFGITVDLPGELVVPRYGVIPDPVVGKILAQQVIGRLRGRFRRQDDGAQHGKHTEYHREGQKNTECFFEGFRLHP